MDGLKLWVGLVLVLLLGCGPASGPSSPGVDQYVGQHGLRHPGDLSVQHRDWVVDSIHHHDALARQLIGPWGEIKSVLIVLHRDTMALNDALFVKQQKMPAGTYPLVQYTLGWVWDGELHLVMDSQRKMALGGLTELLIHNGMPAGQTSGQYSVSWTKGDPGSVHPEWPVWWGQEMSLISRLEISR